MLDDSGDKAGAGALMEGLRAKSPQDVDVLLRVAQFHQRARRFSDAETVLRQARELEPRNQNALFVLGAVLERQRSGSTPRSPSSARRWRCSRSSRPRSTISGT